MLVTQVKKVEKTSTSAKENGKKKSKVLNENKKQDEIESNQKKSATLPAQNPSQSKGKGKNGDVDKLNTLGLDSPYQNSDSNTKPLVVDVTTTPILVSSHKATKQHASSKVVAIGIDPSPVSAGATSSGSDVANEGPVTPVNTCNAARVPVLSASDAANTSSFVRGVRFNV